jgi:hypothetical protein
MTPAVVIAAHRRPDALARLLASLGRASHPAGVPIPLVISIDPPSDPGVGEAVEAVADGFDWRHGPKQVLRQPAPLGLTGNLLACGDLTARFGSIVFLEDDLVVSPVYYASTANLLAAYGADDRVALGCLYGLWFNGYTGDPFEPLDDGSDGFFLGVPYTQGLAFSDVQWARLRPAIVDHRSLEPDCRLHPAFLTLGDDEWFPRLANAIVASCRHVAFPRRSLVSGWGDTGTHFAAPTIRFQVALRRAGTADRWAPLDTAEAVYDPFFELEPTVLRRLAVDLDEVDFELDLTATKPRAAVGRPFVLTTRATWRSIRTYGLRVRPIEANVIDGVPGEAIHLAAVGDVDWSDAAARAARRRVEAYLARDRRPSIRRALAAGIAAVATRGRRP